MNAICCHTRANEKKHQHEEEHIFKRVRTIFVCLASHVNGTSILKYFFMLCWELSFPATPIDSISMFLWFEFRRRAAAWRVLHKAKSIEKWENERMFMWRRKLGVETWIHWAVWLDEIVLQQQRHLVLVLLTWFQDFAGLTCNGLQKGSYLLTQLANLKKLYLNFALSLWHPIHKNVLENTMS